MGEQLLSGFIGALIATCLSILYLYIFERKKLRSEVMLEIVEHLDEIYTKLKSIHLEKDCILREKERQLSEDDYRIFNSTLRDQLNTNKLSVKLEIIYGRGNLLAQFNRLKAFLFEAAMSVWEGRDSNWDDQNRYIHTLLRKKIDPARVDFESLLIKKTKALEIIKDLCLLNKLVQGKAQTPRYP